MRAHYTMSLIIEVYDFDALRDAAKAEALKSMSSSDWEKMRRDNLSPVAADLHMLFDPGVSPPGCSIEDGDCHFDGGEEPEEK